MKEKKNQKDDSIVIQTRNHKEGAQLLQLECRNCGGVLELIDKTHGVCPYCGQKYLIDEAKGTIIDVHVDYGGSAQVRSAMEDTKRALFVVLAVAVVVTLIILGFNIAARKSVFSSSDTNIPVEENGQLLAIFSKDIFGKDYKDITEEEFASVKYLRCGYERSGSETYHVVWYSFTDYADCEDEEAFRDTVKRWTYRTERVNWPSDYTMFTGLTRINTTDAVWLSQLRFSPENHISYVDTDDSLDTVADILNPDQIKVLHIGIMGATMEGIGQFQNLEELTVSTNMARDKVNISRIKDCTKLTTLALRCGEEYTGLESLGALSQLTSLSIDQVNLGDCDFLSQLPQLEELSIETGENPDLSNLAGLPNLKRLYLLDGEYIPLEQIPLLSGLEELKIAVNETESIQALGEISTLKALNLHLSVREYVDYKEQPVDISPLAALTNLENLSVDNFWSGKMAGLEGIFNLPKLKSLQLGLGITSETEAVLDLSLLQVNPSIEKLHLVGSFFFDQSGDPIGHGFLSRYPNVKELYLDESDLTDISFLEELSNLRVCSLQGNDITDYSPLSMCKKLENVCVDEKDADRLALPEEVMIYTEPYYMVY